MNQYLICRMQGAVFSFLLKDQKAVEIHCDRPSSAVQLNNIYVGRVRDIAHSVDAAFVEIAPNTVCYLPLDDLRDPIYTKKGSSEKIQQGDELLVQVCREAIKTKYPSVTTSLTLHGKYILLITGKNQTGASRKLEKQEKQRLTALVKEIEETDGLRDAADGGSRPFGWLLRTNSNGIGRKALRADMERLYAQYRKILTEGIHLLRYSCVVRQESAYITRLSDLYDVAADQYVTDDAQIYEEAKAYLSERQPEDLPRLTLYTDPMQPLIKRYSLEKELERALSDTVWLNCGGYLVIQPTEALTVIDVNSGKYEGGKNRQKAAVKVNREAAAEAARQIRLRNLSGIILIDFINMEDPEENEILMDQMERLLKEDPIRTAVVDMTKLSLLEITRQKKEKPLLEIIKNN